MRAIAGMLLGALCVSSGPSAAYELQTKTPFAVSGGYRAVSADLRARDLFFVVRSERDIDTAKLFATIEARSIDRVVMLGSFACDLIKLRAGQAIAIDGTACDNAPTVLRLPSGYALKATMRVAYEGVATQPAIVDLSPMRPLVADIPLKGITFDAGVYVEPGALSGSPLRDRTLKVSDIAVFVHTPADADDVTISARLSAGSSGPEDSLGVLNCHPGRLRERQAAVYHGNSCDPLSDRMVLPANKNLFATIRVIYGAQQTDARDTQVQEVRVGMPLQRGSP